MTMIAKRSGGPVLGWFFCALAHLAGGLAVSAPGESFCQEPSSPGQEARTGPEPVRNEGTELIQHAIDNGLSWRSGDFLVRTRVTYDSVQGGQKQLNLEGALVAIEEWSRIRFDHDSDRFLFAHSRTEDRTELSLPDPEFPDRVRRDVQSQRGGVVFDGMGRKFASFRSLPRGRSNVVEASFDEIVATWKATPAELMKQHPIPDYRVIGLSVGPDPGELDRTIDWLKAVVASGAGSTVLRGEKIISVTQEIAEQEHPTFAHFDFDARSLMPVRSECFMLPAGGERASISDQIRVEWEEMNGVFVPVKCIRDGYSLRRVGGDRDEWGATQTIADIHWFSLNEELPDDAFATGQIATPASLDELIDPRRAGATRILELLEREKTPSAPDGGQRSTSGK